MQSVQSKRVFVQRAGVGGGWLLWGHRSSKPRCPTPWLWPLMSKSSRFLSQLSVFQLVEVKARTLRSVISQYIRGRMGSGKGGWQLRRPINVILHICSSFFSSSSPLPNPISFSTDQSMQPWKGSSLHARPLALSFLCPRSGGAMEGYSLSMSLYFFLSMDTWSLNRTGSSLIWEWTRGMVPNQLANLFMQVWRWAKWSGSAQRDARELWPIIVSLYCFFWVTLMGGSFVTEDTRKFIRMSSQFDISSTIVFRLTGR